MMTLELKSLPEWESALEAGHFVTIYDGYPAPVGEVITPDPSSGVYKYTWEEEDEQGYIWDCQGRVSRWATLADLIESLGTDVANAPIWMIDPTSGDHLRTAYRASMHDVLRQTLEFSLRDSAFMEQLKRSPEMQQEEVVENVKSFARSVGVSEDALSALE